MEDVLVCTILSMINCPTAPHTCEILKYQIDAFQLMVLCGFYL